MLKKLNTDKYYYNRLVWNLFQKSFRSKPKLEIIYSLFQIKKKNNNFVTRFYFLYEAGLSTETGRK